MFNANQAKSGLSLGENPANSAQKPEQFDPVTAEMRAVLVEIFQRIWIEKQDHLFDTLYHPDVLIEGIVPGGSVGLSDFRDSVKELRMHQEMRGFKIVDFISDGRSRCAVRILYPVYIKAADKTANLSVQCFYTIENRKVTHVHINIDRLGLLEEIGAVPEGAYFIGLAGGHME